MTLLSPDDRFVPEIPNGWFAVAWGRELRPGDVQRVRAFGKDLVLFRTHSGVPRVLSAYCPHLGAHLAEGGRVMGESIRCPFHGWQYDGESGSCVAIPYCERIPANARTRAWPTVDRNHMIFVWHHADEQPPSWEVPELSQLHDSDWSEPREWEFGMRVNVQDMAENNLDPVHFQFVHNMMDTPPTEITFEDDGRVLHASSDVDRETPDGTIRTQLLRSTWGIGLASVESIGVPGVGLYMFSSATPTEKNYTVSRWLITATQNVFETYGEDWIEGIKSGIPDDRRIWENKIHVANPVFCKNDRLLAEFRRWTKQFYSAASMKHDRA
jgi:phenylpropionate dioxygenase-like ring-hydroxylating dioxygenase large terminal subunit